MQKTSIGNDFQYTRVDKLYICLQQSPFLLAWFVIFRNKALRLSSLHIQRKFGLKGFKTIVWYRLGKQMTTLSQGLPICGQVCIPVHRGHKVFDFQRKAVAKIIDSKVDSTIVLKEIESVKMASSLDFAPNVLCCDTNKRWYEEDYIIGNPHTLVRESSSGNLDIIFRSLIEPCLQRMIVCKRPIVKNFKAYIDDIVEAIRNCWLINPDLDSKKVVPIQNFITSTIKRLQPHDQTELPLIFSHGDFSLVNILTTARGIRVIDWEQAEYRSAFYDLYNFFLTEIYYSRADTNLEPRVNQSILDLAARLKESTPIFNNQQDLTGPMYRRLYYIERIRMLLERDLTDRVMNVILQSIKIFDRYEDECIRLGACRP